MLTAAEASRTVAELEREARPEWARLAKFVRYSRGRQSLPWLPDNAETEYRDIARKSASNWLDLVVRATAQGLHVDGYGDKTDDDPDAAPGLFDTVWQANGWDSHQHALHRAVLTLGYSYIISLPTDVPGEIWMRPEAATQMYAVYDDPWDEWPRLAVRKIRKDRWELYDDEARYLVEGVPGAVDAPVGVLEHGAGVTPITRMRTRIDLLGTPMGEIEPVIPIQDRIVDATFTLQMVAKYGAFPQRWIAGIDTSKPLTDADGNPVLDASGNPVFPTIKAYVDHILTALDPDTKFGQFAAADLRQYVDALEAHIRHLAAITQTPPHYLLGSLVNLSAEALAAAEAGLQRKIRDARAVLGEGYEQHLRLSALMLGDLGAAMDTTSQVHWQDVESRSLAQTADALFKLSQLGVPRQMLLPMIPGWTQTDVDKATALIDAGGPLDAIARELAAARETAPAALTVGA